MRWSRAALPAAALAATAAQLGGQEAEGSDTASGEPVHVYEIDPAAAAVPFGPGEYLRYNVKVGPFGVGDGYMAVEAIDTVRGEPAYRLYWAIKGSMLFGAAKIDDKYWSWFDTRQLMSRRFFSDVKQGDYVRRREYEFYPEELWWERNDVDESGELASALPLDIVSFIYYLRTLDFEVGETLTFNRYFKEDGNPVRIEVLRRDERETDAGKFNTIVIRPIIPEEDLFSEKAEAEIHLSDDEHRRVVYMKAELGFLGISISLHLDEIVSGQLIHDKAVESR